MLKCPCGKTATVVIVDLPSVIADDLKVYKKVESVRSCVKLQINMHKIYERALANNLRFNFSKCRVFTISRLKQLIINYYIVMIHDPNSRINISMNFKRTLT